MPRGDLKRKKKLGKRSASPKRRNEAGMNGLREERDEKR